MDTLRLQDVFWKAVIENNIAFVQKLIDQGVDINQKRKWGVGRFYKQGNLLADAFFPPWTALTYSAWMLPLRQEMVLLLLERGATIEEETITRAEKPNKQLFLNNVSKKHLSSTTITTSTYLPPPKDHGFKGRMFIDSVSFPHPLPPLHLFDNFVPSIPVEESLKHCDLPFHDELVSWCVMRTKDLMSSASTFIQTHSLQLQDVFAILVYSYDYGPSSSTQNQNIYFQLNKTLRERNTQELENWKTYLYYLLTALSKLPDIDTDKRRVYRGIDVAVDIMSKYKAGNTISWNSFTSTSFLRSMAKNFLKGNPQGTIFVLDIIQGKEIQEISSFPSEAEILLEPNSEFEVVFSEQLDFTVVNLKQIPTKFPLIRPTSSSNSLFPSSSLSLASLSSSASPFTPASVGERK